MLCLPVSEYDEFRLDAPLEHELIDLTSVSPVSYQSGVAGRGKMPLERLGGLGDGGITIAAGGRGDLVIILSLQVRRVHVVIKLCNQK